MIFCPGPLDADMCRLGACGAARAWLSAGGHDLESGWAQCERGDWMLWLAARVRVDQRSVVAAACACAQLATEALCMPEDQLYLDALSAARAWGSGAVDSEWVLSRARFLLIRAEPFAARYHAQMAVDGACYIITQYSKLPIRCGVLRTTEYADAVSCVAMNASDVGRDRAASMRACAQAVRDVITADAVRTAMEMYDGE